MGDVIEILTTATNTVEVEAQGPQGIPGVGVPTGGSALQVLRKKTSTDYDTEWAAAGSGSGSVTSVALASTDLTISGSPITTSGTITANIAANAVTLEKLQTISSEHLLGRHGNGNGGVQQIGLGTGLAISGSNVGVTFGSSAGTACEGNDSRLSDSRTPTSHAASHEAGVKAIYTGLGDNESLTTPVTLLANNQGTAGNSITLSFNGSDSLTTVIAAWNSANPSNQTTLISGDGSQIPDNEETIQLSGGVAAGSDPFNNINQNLGTNDQPTFDGLVVARNKPSATLANSIHVANFVAQDNTNQAPLVAIGGTGNIEVYKDSAISKALAYGFAQPGLTATDDFIVSLYDPNNGGWRQRLRCAQSGTTSIFGNLVVRDNTGDETATFDAQGNLTANRTYDLPDASGTLALTSNIPANTIASTIVDAKGDLIVGTAADTVARLPVGATNGHVLTVDSAETSGMKWAAASGGVTSVSGTAPIVSSGGTTPTISVTTGSTAGTVCAGDDSRITGAAQKSANLSDLASASTARTNLGLGTAAVAATGDFAAASHAHGNLTSSGAIGSTSGLPVVTTTSGAITTLALGSANQVLKVNSGGTAVEFGAAGGVTSGSVDNAVLRADGTGGSTSQGSAINIEDASTTTENNVAITNQHSGQTNSSLVLTPKGTGAFIVGPRPDGTATGGNARGAQAVDLQYVRNIAACVASGPQSAVLGGENNTASGTESCVIGGLGNIASGSWAIAGGATNTASGVGAVAFGASNTASGAQSAIIAGRNALADRSFIIALSSGQFATAGDAQRIWASLRNRTTSNTAVELFMGFSADTRLTIPSGKVMAMLINITGVKSDGSAVAHYVRQYAIKNVAGTTSQVYAPVTIGTDNAAGTSITLSANDTNDAVKIEVTGIASETWRWVASVDAVEVAYGT